MPTRAQAAGSRQSPTASGRPRDLPVVARAAPGDPRSRRPPRARPRVAGTMRRRSGAAFRVYDEDEFFAAPGDEWLSDAAAPAVRPRFRRLAGGTLLAGAIVAVGAAAVVERPPSAGGSRAGGMLRGDGSRAGYLTARSTSVPIRLRSSDRAPQGMGSSLPSRARTGVVANKRPRAPRARSVPARARTAARARVTTPVGSTLSDASAAAPVPAAVPVPAAAPATTGEGLASVARGAAGGPAAGVSAPAEGRPVASASGAATGREHPEFGFER
jgi:hypothetical protein